MRQSEKVIEAAGFIASQYKHKIHIGIVLGTGLGDLSKILNIHINIPYADIPNFPESRVPFHAARLLIGDINGINIIMMNGRYHYYEGHSMQTITLPVRVLHQLGVKKIIMTNAASSIREDLKPGFLAVIADHINLIGNSPLIGPHEPFLGERFTDMSEPYNNHLIDLAVNTANRHQIPLKKVVFAAFSGPSLLTSAEIKMLQYFGADAIGMSVVPEVLVARQLGIELCTISAITDQSLPEKMNKIKPGAVTKEAEKILPNLELLVLTLVKEINKQNKGK
ncbi:purine-nucleoside phosphorylase [candidate division KSB1 bacterium]|nr:purine-nucleoside phosphorylase [candidate division KSB1 bacterium]